MTEQTRLDPEMLSMVLDTIDKLEKEKITLEAKLEMDRVGDFPEELIRFMLGPEIALHLIFIPEEYGGLGAGTSDIAIVSERMAKMDLAIATSFLAICLGMDPIRVGSTPEQKEKYIGRIAEEGLVVAYGVTEPEAGSNVQSLKTKAVRVLDDDGNIKGYKINGQKQFITNGGVADLYTILADAPDGPTFFIVEGGTEGLIPGKHEDKHGIRASDTCPLTLEDMYVPVENLIGGVEGQGIKQANEVFGYTRSDGCYIRPWLAAWPLLKGLSTIPRKECSSGPPLPKSRAIHINSWCPMPSNWRRRAPLLKRQAGDWTPMKRIFRSRAPLPSILLPRPVMPWPMTASRPLADMATPGNTRWKRSSGTSRSSPFMKGPVRYSRSIISTFRLREYGPFKGRAFIRTWRTVLKNCRKNAADLFWPGQYGPQII